MKDKEYIGYGKCDRCNCDLMAEMFWDKERDNRGILTGRIRHSVGVLYCPQCLKRYCVDDSFDGPWFYPIKEE